MPYVAKSYFETYKSYDHMQKMRFEYFEITRFFQISVLAQFLRYCAQILDSVFFLGALQIMLCSTTHFQKLHFLGGLG